MTRTTVVTGDPEGRVLEDGALAVQGSQIVAVGSSTELEEEVTSIGV